MDTNSPQMLAYIIAGFSVMYSVMAWGIFRAVGDHVGPWPFIWFGIYLFVAVSSLFITLVYFSAHP